MSAKRRNNKNKGNKRSIFSFIFLLWLVNKIFSLKSIGIILAGVASLAVAAVIKIMSSDQDLSTHNKEQEGPEPDYYRQFERQPRKDTNNQPREGYATKAPRPNYNTAPREKPAADAGKQDEQTANDANQVKQKNRQMPQIPKSGDEQADATVKKGLEMIRRVRQENDAIPDEKLSEQMEQLEKICLQIFRTVAEKPAKAPQIRKFMNYYLPTTLNMLANYHTMQDRGVSKSELQQVHSTLEYALDMVVGACQKQLDNLYRDNKLDVSTDIEVLEQMLVRDGLVDPERMGSNPDAATAAASMPRVPTIQYPEELAVDDDYDAIYRTRYEAKK